MLDRKTVILQCAREIHCSGGVAQVAWQLEKHFQAMGYQLQRLSFETLGLKARARYSDSMWLSKLWLLWEVVIYTLLGTWRLYRLRKKHPNWVVICHHDILGGDIYIDHGLHKALVLSKKSPLRFVLKNPLHIFLLVREEIRHRFGCYKKVVEFSEPGKQQLLQYYPKIQAEQICIVPNAVDQDRFAPIPVTREKLRMDLGLQDCFTLLFVGHEFDRKGLIHVLAALKHLPDKVVLLVIGGNKALIKSYSQIAEQYGVANRVKWLGIQTETEKFYNAADVFVMPTSAEAWGLAAIESLSCGLPILVTPVIGIKEFLHENHNGFFIEQDAKNIAEQVEKLISNPSLYGKLKNNARASIAQYCWSDISRQYLTLLQGCESNA